MADRSYAESPSNAGERRVNLLVFRLSGLLQPQFTVLDERSEVRRQRPGISQCDVVLRSRINLKLNRLIVRKPFSCLAVRTCRKTPANQRRCVTNHNTRIAPAKQPSFPHQGSVSSENSAGACTTVGGVGNTCGAGAAG